MANFDLTQSNVAVVGGGLIGAAWAALFLHYGAQLRVWDPSAAARETLLDRMGTPLEQLAQLTKTAARGKIEICDDLAQAVAKADLIQENAPEDIPTKHDLFARIEAAAPEAAVIASSTSAFTWSDLAPGLTSAERFITAHPFNPPHLIPLVEVFGANQDAVEKAEQFYRAVDRVPVRLKKDATGHIANRLASALWREAVHMVAEGIADVSAIDAALVQGPGLRWSVLGAHMAYHLGGGSGGMAGYLEHLGPSQERRWADLGTPTLSPETRAALIEGTQTQAAGRSIAQLEQERDAALIQALLARQA